MTCPLAATAGIVPAVLAVLEYSPPCLPSVLLWSRGCRGEPASVRKIPWEQCTQHCS